MTKNPARLRERGFCKLLSTSRPVVLGRPGNDLLSQALRLSTIGAEAFNGRVRDGIGFWAPRNCHQVDEKRLGEFWFLICISGTDRRPSTVTDHGHGVMRTIKPIELLVPVSFTHCWASTSGLSTWWSSTALIGNTGFEGGFPLRCFQRLSRPDLATLHCGWRHNRSTRDPSTPVLSY